MPPFHGEGTLAPPDKIPRLVALAREAAAGDRASLERLLTELHPVLRRYALRVAGDERDIPSDIAQEALIRVGLNLHDLRAQTDEQLISWCLVIVRNLSIDWLRRAWFEPAHAPAELATPGAATTDEGHGSSAAPRQHIFDILRTCESQLEQVTRTILYLRLVEGAPWEAIARDVGLPATATKRRYQRAQRKLRREVLAAAAQLSDPERAGVLDQLQKFGVHVDGH